MKILVSTVGEIDARKKAIVNEDMARYIKATAGKKITIDVPSDATLDDLIAGVRELGDIKPHIAISRVVVLKGKTPVKGATLLAGGLTDGSEVTMKFVHTTA
jgi:hypothetical protein